ncbi:MAG TPA: VOC family protein [Solirubrobacterales bacterium]|nr:VOC family protein [Solirubrobacterales bacterium]
MAVTIDELIVADEPGPWSGIGFAVQGDAFAVGAVRIRLAGREAGEGLCGWSLRGLGREGDAGAGERADGAGVENQADGEEADLDGLATTRSERDPPAEEPVHPNGIVALDHVVAISSDLDRTVAALRGAGLDLRRVREEPTPAGAPRQAFFRLGAEILEVVQAPPEAIERTGGDRPAFFWGLAFVAPDLEATAARLGEHVSEVRDAVQPGRRIATLRRSAGLALPVALMTPAA